MSRRLSDCSCTWTVVLSIPMLSVREPSCTQHGDDTDWWKRLQEHARSLGGVE